MAELGRLSLQTPAPRESVCRCVWGALGGVFQGRFKAWQPREGYTGFLQRLASPPPSALTC